MINVNAVQDVNNVESLYEYLKSMDKVLDKHNVRIQEMVKTKTCGEYESALFEYCYMKQMLGIDSVRLWLIEDATTVSGGESGFRINKAHLFVSYVNDDYDVVWVEPWMMGHEAIRTFKSYVRMLKNVKARFTGDYKVQGKIVIGEVVSTIKMNENMREDTLLGICNRGLEVAYWMGHWRLLDKPTISKNARGNYYEATQQREEQTGVPIYG